MIVSDKHKFVYIAIPKTGSTSTWKWLVENYECIDLKHKKWGRNKRGWHSYNVPDRFKNHIRFTVVRNPYERMFSLWWHHCGGHEIETPIYTPEEANEKFVLAFDQWFDTLMACRKHPELKQFIKYNAKGHGVTRSGAPHQMKRQTEIIAGGRIDRFIHLENIDEEIRQIPQFKNAPRIWRINVATSKPKKSFNEFFQSKELEQRVWDYCRDEFEAFGYKREIL